MASLTEIYEWFKTGKKPTQAQFWATFASFWNKEEQIPQSAITGLTTVLNAKAESVQFNAHKSDGNAHQALFDLKVDKDGDKVLSDENYTLFEKEKLANLDKVDVYNALDCELPGKVADARQLKVLKDLIDNSGGGSQINKFVTIYTSGLQEFTLPTFAQIIEVSVNGWSTENYTTPNDTTVIINDTINTGQQVVILYLADKNLNIAPYYTQAQTEALIAGGATTTDILPSDLVFLDLGDNPLPYTLTLLDGFKYTLGNYGFIELSLESSVTSEHNYFFKITIDNILIPNDIIALGSLFNDIGDSRSISILKLSNNSIYILSPNPSPEAFNKLTISLKYKII